MSTAIARNFQIGIDPTPSNNFTLYQPATPDGTLRLGNGNTGITSSLLTLSSAGQLSFVAGSAAAPTLSPAGDSNTGIFFPAADTIAFAEGGVEAMRLDSSGNLAMNGGSILTQSTSQGIAIFASPTIVNNTSRIEINGTTAAVNPSTLWTRANTIIFTRNDASLESARIDSSGNFVVNGGTFLTQTTSQSLNLFANPTIVDNTPRIEINGTTAGSASTIFVRANTTIFTRNAAASESARIDSSGLIMFGRTTPFSSDTRVNVQAQSGGNGMGVQVGSNGNYAIYINNTSGTTVGGIIGNSGSVSYNTTVSDYRLKDNIADFTGGLAAVKAMRPVTFSWKDTGQNDFGFIAHELQAVIPETVTGDKDSVDADGNPKYQSVFPAPTQMIATLVAAIKEQQAIIEQLKADVAALKGA